MDGDIGARGLGLLGDKWIAKMKPAESKHKIGQWVAPCQDYTLETCLLKWAGLSAAVGVSSLAFVS